jgi:acetate kinase
VRKIILEALEEVGVALEEEKHEAAIGAEGRRSNDGSKVQVPTNEEIIVIREACKLLSPAGDLQGRCPRSPKQRRES